MNFRSKFAALAMLAAFAAPSIALAQAMVTLAKGDNVNLVMQTCERVHVLDFGRVLAAGTADEIRRDPAVIAAYLGAQA